MVLALNACSNASSEKISLIIDIDPFQDGALALAQKMPWHDIGVMLHDRKHDLVAFPDEGFAEGSRDQIDRFGRRFREDDLTDGAGVEKCAYAFPRRLIGIRRGIGEIMQAAMDIGVFVVGRMDHAIDDLPRFLCRGGIIEINERLAVNISRKDGEILAQTQDIKWGVDGDMFVHARSIGVWCRHRMMPGGKPSPRLVAKIIGQSCMPDAVD